MGGVQTQNIMWQMHDRKGVSTYILGRVQTQNIVLDKGGNQEHNP